MKWNNELYWVNEMNRESEKHMTTIERLKNLQPAREDLDTLVLMAATAGTFRESYTANKLPVPEWLVVAARDLDKEIKQRRIEYAAKRKTEIAQSKRAMRTREQKLADLEKEEQALNDIIAESV